MADREEASANDRHHASASGSATSTDYGLRPIAAVLAASAIGLSASNCLPLLLGAIVEAFSVRPWEAGLVGSVELGGVALAALLLAPWVRRVSRVRLALAGALLATAAQLLSALAGSYALLLSMRALAGLGEGIALAAGMAAVAASPDPDRLYARVALLGGLGAAALLALLPLAIAPWGYAGGYAALAVICLAASPLLSWLPDARGAAGLRGVPGRGAGYRILFGIGILAVGQGGLWAFAERIGASIAIETSTIGRILGAAALFGLFGAAAAAALGTRVGRSGPLAAGLCALGIGTLGLAHASSATAYTGFAFTWMLAFLFTLPYVMGSAAALDAGGRWVAAATGASTIGTALGPVLAGLVATRFGYPVLGWFALGCAAFAIAGIVPVARSLDRR